MTKLSEKFKGPGTQDNCQGLTMFDYSQYLNGVVKAAVSQSQEDTRLLNHVAASLFSPFYDLQHKLAVARPGAHFTDAEMKRVPFAQIRPDLQKGIDQFLSDPHKVVSNEFWQGCVEFLATGPAKSRHAAPELAAA